MNDRLALGCEKHMNVLEIILSVFKKDNNNDATLIGNNVSVNKSVATNLGLRFWDALGSDLTCP